MLEKKKDSSWKFSDDIGCINELQLKLHMNDHTLVQNLKLSIFVPESEATFTYNKVEVPISYPVVCACKRNGEIRPCVDYAKFHKRTTPF